MKLNYNKILDTIAIAVFVIMVLILLVGLNSCTSTRKNKSETSTKIDSTNVKHESNIDIKTHVEDSSSASKKSIENNTDSSNTKTVTIILDKDTTGKQTEISIKVDSNGTVNIKSNKPLKSVNTKERQVNTKQQKQSDSNASHTTKANTDIKASDKGDSTNKKAAIDTNTSGKEKSSFSIWGWLIIALAILLLFLRARIMNWLANI